MREIGRGLPSAEVILGFSEFYYFVAKDEVKQDLPCSLIVFGEMQNPSLAFNELLRERFFEVAGTFAKYMFRQDVWL